MMKMEVYKKIFVKPPYKGVSINCALSYVDKDTFKMVRICTFQNLSDRPSQQYISYSTNNGMDWNAGKLLNKYKVVKDGTIRYSTMPWLDEDKGILFLFHHTIYMKNDEVLTGLYGRKIFYQYSKDGGNTFTEFSQIIESGREFDEKHYMRDVWYGRNSASIGNIPIKLSANEILLPLYYFPLDRNGRLYNPIGAYTYTNVVFLHGFWRNKYIEWISSDPITIDPYKSTRGLSEPAVIELDNGILFTVMRGSNDKMPSLPGYKWISVSEDGGWSWSKPEPFKYDDGEKILSPASYSALIKHSSGKVYWIGNISKTNPVGNSPRYPLVIGEIDQDKMALKRSTITIIDTKRRGESKYLQLSNFNVYEDRKTREIVVTLARLFPQNREDWTAPCYMYRIKT